MLALNLSRIRTAQDRFEREYPPDTPALASDDYRLTAPVVLRFDIHKDKQQFRLVGRITTTLELDCGRCLDPFVCPVDAEFDLRYLPHSVVASGSGSATGGKSAIVGGRGESKAESEREIEADDLTTTYYENDEIDLAQLMQEQFYLTLPMKPLCRDDCKGLCPVCGTNWNRGTCNCTTQWEDPRLAALRALKKES